MYHSNLSIEHIYNVIVVDWILCCQELCTSSLNMVQEQSYSWTRIRFIVFYGALKICWVALIHRWFVTPEQSSGYSLVDSCHGGIHYLCPAVSCRPPLWDLHEFTLLLSYQGVWQWKFPHGYKYSLFLDSPVQTSSILLWPRTKHNIIDLFQESKLDPCILSLHRNGPCPLLETNLLAQGRCSGGFGQVVASFRTLTQCNTVWGTLSSHSIQPFQPKYVEKCCIGPASWIYFLDQNQKQEQKQKGVYTFQNTIRLYIFQNTISKEYTFQNTNSKECIHSRTS